MTHSATIQRLTGFLILLVFTLSATPKVFFHDMVADHSDGPECILDHNTTVVHTRTFDCEFDDLVVSVPFVMNAEPSEEILHDYAEIEQFSFYNSRPVQSFLHKENRGPPVV
ncbi:MAG: hypothetical protein ACXWV9_08755 [Flavisolibacter sp.]